MNITKKLRVRAIDIMIKYGRWIPDYIYLKIYSVLKIGEPVDLKNPKSYNDKINWIKLYDRNPTMTICADKFKVRQFIKEKIGEDVLVPLLWHGDNPKNIPFNKLPDSFVLKTNNASGTNIIVRDKKNIDQKQIVNQLNIWLKQNYYYPKREWVYKNIEPQIVCESFIEQENEEELRDYRFFCFNGNPEFVTVDFSINEKSKTRRNLYDLNWTLMDEEISYPKEINIEVNKPKKLNQMIEYCKILSEGFRHVRIDFYFVNNKIIFGEMTFYHQSGLAEFRPKKFGDDVGALLKL